MPRVNIDTLGLGGVNRDEKPHTLDLALWSDLVNVRCLDGCIQSIGGREQVFGTLTVAPYFIIPISTGAATLWVWAGLTDVSVYDSAEVEITRTSGDYAATGAKDWNGTILGGILVLNNGIDLPQYWATPTTGTKLADLPNWNSAWRAKVIRAFKQFLVAINITKSGTNSPHMVKWSHLADPGAVPASWDETDATVDAGESELPDVESGTLQDALALRGELLLYKEGSIWRMRFIGGQNIFGFDEYLTTAGVLTHRCVGLLGTGNRHFVVAQDDIFVHDGSSEPESILSKRMRRYLFNVIDPSNYAESFVFANPRFQEMWFCYPSSGVSSPDMALIYNYKTGAVTEAEVDFVAAAVGPVAQADSDWDSDTGAWDDDLTAWDETLRRRVLVAKPSATKVLQMDQGNTFDGTVVECRAQRLGLGMVGEKRDGTPIVDFQQRKMVTRLYPRMEGGPVDIRLAAQDELGGAARWTSAASFDPTSQKFIDRIIEGAAIGVEYRSQADVAWRLEGHQFLLELTGEF